MTVPTVTSLAAGTWTVDPAHSKIGFSVKHMGIATVRGHFNAFVGSLHIAPDKMTATAGGTVQAASVDTGEARRDAHLRSADFFDVDAYPELRFTSTLIEPTGKNRFRIVGDLNLHGVAREIILEAEVEGTTTDASGDERAGLTITGELSRSEFGMRFNQAIGGGNMLVSDLVRLNMDFTAVRHSS